MEFVPSNIIKTPDFGSMAQKAMNQKRQDINEMNSWMDSNKKKEGAYLEGDKPAVQEAWNKYQDELDRAVESGDRDARRKADEAYGSYSQIAGTAMALAEQYRSQVASYKADPSKYSIGGQEFLSLSDEYRRTKRSADDIVLAVQNPFVIAQSMKYDLANPVDQATKMAQMSSAKTKDFYSDTGQLNSTAARRYAEELADSFIRANESSVEKAMAWGGIRTGYAGGEDGMLNSMEELEFLRNQPEEKRVEFIGKYRDELVANYMKMLPRDLKQKDDKDGKGGLDKGFERLQPYPDATVDLFNPPANVARLTMYPMPSKIDDIESFGYDEDGRVYVTEVKVVEVDKEEDGKFITVKEKQYETREATDRDISFINSKSKGAIDYYRPRASQNSVSSQEEKEDQSEDKDSLGIL